MGSLSVSVRLPCSHNDGGSLPLCCIFSVCTGTAHWVVLFCSDTDVQSRRVDSCFGLWLDLQVRVEVVVV